MLGYPLNPETGKQRHTQREDLPLVTQWTWATARKEFQISCAPQHCSIHKGEENCQSHISLHQLEYIHSISVVFQNHWQRKKKNLERQWEAKSTLFHIKEQDGRFPQILTHFSDSEHTDCQHLCTCTTAVQTKKQHVGRRGKHYSSGTASIFHFNMVLICSS